MPAYNTGQAYGPQFNPSLYPNTDFNSSPIHNPAPRGYAPRGYEQPQAPAYPDTNYTASPYYNFDLSPPPNPNLNVKQYPEFDIRPPVYHSAEDYKVSERSPAPTYSQPNLYPGFGLNPPSHQNLYPQPEPPSANPYPNYSLQPNLPHPAFEGSTNYRPQAAPYRPTAPEVNNENYCSMCAEAIFGTDMLVLSCLHKYHHQCIRNKMPSTCLSTGCGYSISTQEKAAISSKVTPSNVARCKICMNMIHDVKKDAAVHCLKMTSKIHKECFIIDVEKQTNGMVLLTKGEAAKLKVMCPICGGEVNEDAVKRNLLPEKYQLYKVEREQREREDKKRLDEEKRAKIKPKCCGKELNKNEFVIILEGQGIQNAIIMTCNIKCNT